MRPEQLVGRTLAGKYRLDAMIGKGGFGAVFRATHHPIGRTVAVKISLHAHRQDLTARFVREAKVQAGLRHPACVMLLDFGQDDDLFYMVQEFVDGRPLKAELEAQGTLAPARAIRITRRILDGLAAAHRLGIVHRDIKPANIMLTTDPDGAEDVRVLDFGIAKVLSSDDDASLTGTGMSLGTPAFMAPEQIRNQGIDATADLYAVGAQLFRLCAGWGPYAGAATIDILQGHLAAEPPRLPFGCPPLDAIIARAMAKAPADRFQSAGEMSEALGQVQAQLAGVPAQPRARPGETTAVDGSTTALSGGVVVEPTPSTEAPPRRAALLVWPLLLVVGAGLGFIALSVGEPEPTEARSAVTAEPSNRIERPPAPTDAAIDATRPGPDAAVMVIETINTVVDAATPPPVTPKPPVRRRRDRDVKPRRPTTRQATGATGAKAVKAAQARIARALRDCRCGDAAAALDALREASPTAAQAMGRRYEEDCQMYAPTNCVGRAEQ